VRLGQTGPESSGFRSSSPTAGSPSGEVVPRPPFTPEDASIFPARPGRPRLFGLKLAIDNPAVTPNRACPADARKSSPPDPAPPTAVVVSVVGLHKRYGSPPGCGRSGIQRAGREIFGLIVRMAPAKPARSHPRWVIRAQ